MCSNNKINSEFSMTYHVDRSHYDGLTQRIQHNGPWDHWKLYQLAFELTQEKCIKTFDELQCLNHISEITLMPHQLETASKVVQNMRGRAILADEVGLGKTIEAGLILKEYIVRGLVKKTLILVPASLVLQWVRELNQKFNIQAVAQKKLHTWQADVVVASMDTAKRDPHKELLLSTDYDMVIIDEAHKLKNKKTTNYQFILQLRKKFCLLLTATPIQNDLGELYNLITLLKPGQLGAQNEFTSNFVVDKRQPKNEVALQEQLSKIMIRNRRNEQNVGYTKRIVKNIPLTLSTEEQALYDGVTKFIKDRFEENNGNIMSMLPLLTLQREVCSSRDAVFLTLINLSKKLPEQSPLREKIWEIVYIIKNITANTKAEKALQIVNTIDDKVILFTEYRATQEYLLRFFREKQMMVVPYRGGMNRGKKDWMMDLFRGRAKMMIATEAGGEGINLQFCHHMINFDLPWNPMRVEQRIGRIHRLGQLHDVKIYNLCTTKTIEEHIVNLLHEKINMFELVIGRLDMIIEKLDTKTDIEKTISRMILESKDDTDLQQRVNHLGTQLNEIKQKTEFS